MKKKKIVFATLAFCFITPLFYYYLLDDINLNHPYEITYKDDSENVILNTLQDKIGLYIPYEEIPSNFIEYLLCIEDKNFFSHQGLNINRLFKATWNNLFSSSTQGGSTITMQLARILFLNQKRTISRKVKEIFYAIKLEQSLPKEKILEYYLNSIYFAHGLYGIRTASYYYFEKDVKDLSLYEMAMLIGILNSPNNYSPYMDLSLSKKKTSQILMTLQKNKIISTKEYYQAYEDSLNLKDHNNVSQQGINDYYLDACLQEIKTKNLIGEKDYLHGVIIETFLNQNLQEYIKKQLKSIDFGDYNVATVVMETNTSKVISLIGGKNYEESSFNRAVNAKKQIGSTIKPLLYYLALVNGFTPLTELESKKTVFNIKDYGDYAVSNAGEIYANRKITMLEALAMSDNIYAVKTLLALGISPLKKQIEAFNINVDVDNVTMALGANSMSLLELTSIYNCIASGGLFYKPKFIKKISRSKNETIYQTSALSNQRLLFKKECEVLRSLMRAPFDKGLKTYASPSLLNYYISSDYGAKTGTTESSSWVVGFSKKYTIGVYVGSDDNTYLDKGVLSREIYYRIGKYLDENLGYFDVTTSISPFTLYNTINQNRSFQYYTN